jgi:signal transduction histidine kinase
VAVLGTALALSYVARTLGGYDGGVPYSVWLFVLGALTAIGLVRDLRPAFERTRARVAAAGGGRRTGGPLSVLRIFVDELVPGREAGRAEAAEDERGRLAADLHAEVLPSLRRALSEAEAGGTVERLAADLRVAVDEVESLLVARRSIVLEELGLLAAVEWLAERVEDRSAVRVEIEVAGTDADGGRPPRDVERAAFRVAQLALDNVVRHAPGSRAVVSVTASARAVRLRVEDDGDGPPVDEAAATRAGRRGIADMRAEARACGARLEVGRGVDGRGTAVELAWPA